MSERLKNIMNYAKEAYKEKVSISDNDFVGGQGLHYVKLPNNQAVVIDRLHGDVVKFLFDENGEIRDIKKIDN